MWQIPLNFEIWSIIWTNKIWASVGSERLHLICENKCYNSENRHKWYYRGDLFLDVAEPTELWPQSVNFSLFFATGTKSQLVCLNSLITTALYNLIQKIMFKWSIRKSVSNPRERKWMSLIRRPCSAGLGFKFRRSNRLVWAWFSSGLGLGSTSSLSLKQIEYLYFWDDYIETFLFGPWRRQKCLRLKFQLFQKNSSMFKLSYVFLLVYTMIPTS